MPRGAKLPTRLSPKQTTDLERVLGIKQRRGNLKECFRPSQQQRDEGEVPKCELRFYLLAPTFRFCPGCRRYRSTLASGRHKKKIRKERLDKLTSMATTNSALDREKEALVKKNTAIQQQLLDKNAAVARLQEDKVAFCQAARQWHLRFQSELATNSELMQQATVLRDEVPSLTQQLHGLNKDATSVSIFCSPTSQEQQAPQVWQAYYPNGGFQPTISSQWMPQEGTNYYQ